MESPSLASGTSSIDKLASRDPQTGARLRLFAGLEPDWDGFGGRPPSEKALELATVVILVAYRVSGGNLDRPSVAPLVDGGVEMEWEVDTGRELMVTVPPDGRHMQFVYTEQGNSGETGEESGFLPGDASISQLVDRLTRVAL